jgi:hypothetical protein
MTITASGSILSAYGSTWESYFFVGDDGLLKYHQGVSVVNGQLTPGATYPTEASSTELRVMQEVGSSTTHRVFRRHVHTAATPIRLTLSQIVGHYTDPAGNSLEITNSGSIESTIYQRVGFMMNSNGVLKRSYDGNATLNGVEMHGGGRLVVFFNGDFLRLAPFPVFTAVS